MPMSPDMILDCKKCTHGNKMTVSFPDGIYTFHAHWLHDARCDDGPSKNAITAICQQPISTARAENVQLSGEGASMTLDVIWDDGLASKFPAVWLRAMAPLVAKYEGPRADLKQSAMQGWLVDTLEIPEVSYREIFPKEDKNEDLDDTIMKIPDQLLDESIPGIVKITDLPVPNIDEERNHKNNINTQVLKRLFGSVFIHPIRGHDQTFNVSSHNDDARRADGVPNYDTTQSLLPHTDHAFYTNPIQVQGFYCLEDQSENTWVSILVVLATFKQESPDLYKHLCKAPMTFGRVSRFYGDPLY